MISETFRKALASHRAGQAEDAEAAYRVILAGEPGHFGALHHLGALRAQRGDNEEAAVLLGKAAAIDPSATVVHIQLGGVLAGLGRREEALSCYDKAVSQRPDVAQIRASRGCVLLDLRRFGEALRDFDDALRARPQDPLIHANRGAALHALERSEEALEAYNRAVALAPSDVEARCSRGLVLAKLGRVSESNAEFERAAAVAPENPEVFVYWGRGLSDDNAHHEALAALDRAIALKPDHAEAHAYRAAVLRSLHRLDEGLEACDRALALDPDLAMAYYNRSALLSEMKRPLEALADLDKGQSLVPNLSRASGADFSITATLCAWRDYPRRLDMMLENHRAGRKVDPFLMIYATDDPAEQLTAARRVASAALAGRPASPAIARSRLRIAYVSPDFRNHPVTHQIVELLERHDRSRFEIYGISLVRGRESPLRTRIEHAFDHFVEAETWSDRAIVGHLRGAQIDIVVDLAGNTEHCRPAIFAQRPAPVIVSYLGYPATQGAAYIDYLIADPYVAPAGAERHYSENVVRLPDTYMPSDTVGRETMPPVTRPEEGLPGDAVVFAAFHASAKLTPRMFDVWMRLLTAVEGSVLWLATKDEAHDNLRAEAQDRGVSPSRLLFATRHEARERHLARLPLADIFLDAFPYNAHSTATDMLWAGVPVVTLSGRSFASRVAGSLLTAIGAADLITTDIAAYEALALDLARSEERRSALRRRILENRKATALFDTATLCRHLEAAYREMWRLHCAGMAPHPFDVAAGEGGRIVSV